MTRASGGESRGRGYAGANARIQASSDAQQGRAPVLPHHAPAQGPSAAAAAAPWVRRVGAVGPLPTPLLPPPPLGAAAAPPPPLRLPGSSRGAASPPGR